MTDLLAKGVELIEKDSFGQAIEEFKDVLDQYPENIDALYNIALCYDELGKFQESIAYYEKLLELSIDDLDAYIYLARAYLKVSDLSNALLIIEKYLSIKEGEDDYSQVFSQIMDFVDKKSD